MQSITRVHSGIIEQFFFYCIIGCSCIIAINGRSQFEGFSHQRTNHWPKSMSTVPVISCDSICVLLKTCDFCLVIRPFASNIQYQVISQMCWLSFSHSHFIDKQKKTFSRLFVMMHYIVGNCWNPSLYAPQKSIKLLIWQARHHSQSGNSENIESYCAYCKS